MSDNFQFPKNFLWGAATSSHQVEGGNHNDWSEWEKSSERVANLKKRGLNPEEFISGRACDHYNRFCEDFDIAKSLGHNAHRFSIEWSRIEPEEGRFDEKEIEHYREVIKALRERGMEPFVTLWHWTIPVWVRDQGGWGNKKTILDFLKYCERMGTVFKDGVKYWIVLNEPEYWFGNAFGSEKFPVSQTGLISGLKTYWHLVLAHKLVYRRLKAINSSFFVGVVESTGWIAPEFLRWVLHDLRNFLFPWLVKGYFDFFGLNYYRRTPLIGGHLGELSEIGWEIYPKGLYKMITGAYWRFRKPIMITENGIADSIDTKRSQFIQDHIEQIGKAIHDGIDVRGYFYWSLLDNFEWDSGFGPRFGLVEVDYKNALERKIRPSAWKYRDMVRENSA